MLSKGVRITHIFLVSESVYTGFMSTFADRNPYHVDDEIARAKGFKRRIMHGNILCGFLSYFVGQCLPTSNVVIQSETIAFHKPVYLGDELSFEAEVTDFFESVNTAEIRFQFVNQSGAKVAKGNLSIGLL